MKKVVFIFLSVVLLFGLLLSACDGGSGTTTATTTTTPITTTSTPPLVGGGTLKLYGIDPTTLDPALSADANSHEYVIQIFSGLVKLDDNLEPAPDIAKAWEISQDNLTFTFHLREDVVFHDGRKVTAADFKYSWERACNPATGSFVAGTYLGDIVGVSEVLAGRAAKISGIEVINDYTLRVTIDAPKSYFLSKLTYPTAMVVDKNNVAEGTNWWRKPNGTGPFKLKEWQQNSSLVLERNNNYYGEIASLEFVDFQLYSGVPMDLYESGEIDVVGVSAYYIDRITDTAGPFYNQLRESPQLSFSWIGFNTNEPPFDDVNVREAFTMAVDRDKIIELTLRNLVQRADGILPPGIPGYNEELVGLGFDADKAKEFIAASKYGSVANLPPITLTTSGYGGALSQVLEGIIVQWRENLGVEVKVRQLEPERYVYYLKEEKDNMFDMGWIADYPHPQNFLDVLFHTGADSNFAEYSNPALDALLEQAGIEPDTVKSLAMYRQAEQMLVDDAAVLSLWFGRNYILVKPYVEGYELNAMGYVMLNKVKIKEH
ncbi:MAG: ABC transporter substrate-binding protein [Chloroflexi bacterium RBG_16_50_11]|nr:MAG: ABC transporter substrate-binding protein [Chloroflexi bacterium RBG_16_50_11]